MVADWDRVTSMDSRSACILSVEKIRPPVGFPRSSSENAV